MLRRFALAVLVGLVVVSSASWGDEAPPKPTEPEIAGASVEGQNALAGFKLPADLRGELYAAEPLLANPVCFSFDERGRLFVVETFRQNAGVTDNRGHDQAWLDDDLAAQTVADRIAYHKKHLGAKAAEYTQKDDRVRLIEDRDGDGRAETASIFANGFNGLEVGSAAGVLAYRGDVFFTCIPDLWRLRDSNDDGQADERKSLHTGFGVRVAFRGHDLHGLILGPDRRLYFSVGDRGYHVVTSDGQLADPESGAVFRCRLDGTGLEVVATGLRNPQELAFDDFGNLFTGDNNSDSGDKARWVYVVEGGDSGWRMSYQYLPDRGLFNREKLWHPFHAEQPAYIVPPIDNFADGPAGLAFDPGVGLPAAYRGRFFLCDFRGGPVNSGVRTFRVRPKGAFFELVDQEQSLWNILATDVAFGLDGSLYVSDWVNGWNGEGKGRIYRFASPEMRDDPLVNETRTLLSGGLAAKSVDELRRLLGHADRRVRMEAQFALVDRNDLATLLAAAQSDDKLFARLHGLWGATMLAPQRAEDRAAIRALVADADPEMRGQAARTLGELRDATSIPTLIECLRDDAPRVRYFAAMALGKLGDSRAVQPLAALLELNADADPIVRHGGIMGLTGVREAAALKPLFKHPSSSVRVAVVVALRKRRDAEVGDFVADLDPRVVAEAARAIHDVPLPDADFALKALTSRTSADDDTLRRALNATFRSGTAEDAHVLAEIAAMPAVREPMRLEALAMLGKWAKPSPRDRVLGMWRPIPPRDPDSAKAALHRMLPSVLSGPSAVRNEGAKLAAKLGILEVAATLQEMLADRNLAASSRADALLALAELNPNLAAGMLEARLDDSAAEVRGAARKILLKIDPDRAVAAMARAAESAEQTERQAAIAALGASHRAAAAAALRELLEKLVQGKVSDDSQLDVIEAIASQPDRELKARLAAWELAQASADRAAKFRTSLIGGDAERGRQVFFEKTEASCVRCHKVGTRGGEVGPDLSKIAVDKSRQYLLEAIVDPNRAIAKGFESITAVDADGRVHVGVVRKEDDRTVQIITADAKTVTLNKADLEERQPAKSPMPEDVVTKLSRFELRDLVEFLSQCR